MISKNYLDMVKAFLKIIGGLLIGAVIGVLIAIVIVMAFTDITFPEFIDKVLSINGVELLLSLLAGVVALIISLLILMTAHEAGHLVCGLLSGYCFVSFRIFNLTFINIGGKLRIKRFGIDGTGGQCLLDPPEIPVDRIPTFWYNAGGVLANLLLLCCALPLFLTDVNPFVKEGAVIFVLTDVFLILANGIPMKINGCGNDGYNCLKLRHNIRAKEGLTAQLRSNSKIQQGVRPKDMPEEWFTIPEKVDYANPLEVAVPMMAASREIDRQNFKGAREMYEDLYSHRKEIMPLYLKEIACELAFLRLIAGEKEKAQELLDKDLRKYIETYRRMMSSKERVIFAIKLILENDRQEAERILDDLRRRSDSYLLQGEVKSDLALMEGILQTAVAESYK